MKEVKTTSEGLNHLAIDLGSLNQISDYSYIHHKLHHEVKGKIFLGEILKSSSAEISFNSLPPHTDIPFLHKHRNHEEIYITLKGSGQFQVDGNIFNISEGSVVKVMPEGVRTLRNTSDDTMIYICLQVQAGSLNSRYIEDGSRVPGEISWK